MINYSLVFTQPSVVIPLSFVNLQLTATRNSTVITVTITIRAPQNTINQLQSLVGNRFSLIASSQTLSKELIVFCNPLLIEVSVNEFLNAGRDAQIVLTGSG